MEGRWRPNRQAAGAAGRGRVLSPQRIEWEELVLQQKLAQKKDFSQGHSDETILSSFQQTFPKLLLTRVRVVKDTDVVPALMKLQSHRGARH